MPVKLNGATSGSVTIDAPAVAGTNTLTLPAVTDTLVGLAATQTLTNKTLTGTALSAGTTSVAPLDFAAGANLTTALAGAMEYDGKVFYGTPQSTQRGVIPGMQFFRVNSSYLGANTTASQSVFGFGVTLSASTVYAFEALYYLTRSGATGGSHQVGFGFSLTNGASISNILYNAIGYGGTGGINSSTALISQYLATSITNVPYSPSFSTSPSYIYASLKGTVSITSGGTFTPQYTLTGTAPGSGYNTVSGSYFLIYPIGASGSNVNVGTWA